MRLYLIAGEMHAGKTTFGNCFKKKLQEDGLKVCTFQRSKGYYDLSQYGEDHFILPPVAFRSQAELQKWIPTGYDVGICEFVTYSFASRGGYTNAYLSLFSDSRINEVIPPELTPPERDTTKLFSKLETPIENVCTFTTDREIHRDDLLTYIDIDGEYEPRKYGYKVLALGFVPSIYTSMFSDVTYSSVKSFSSDLQDYDLGIIGLLNGEPDDEIREIYESLPTDRKVFSMNPRAFADTTAGKNRDRAEAIAQSSYSDICYAIYKNIPSVTRTETRLLINGIPPAKFLIDLGWF